MEITSCDLEGVFANEKSIASLSYCPMSSYMLSKVSMEACNLTVWLVPHLRRADSECGRE